jgi:tocopherol cyclase
MARYRRAGADPLFRDPARDHGAPFEGYYWRFTDAVRRRVVVALCGLSTHPGTRSALVGLAVHPEGVVRSAILPEARGDAGRFGVSAGDALDASTVAVRVAPTPGDGVEVTIEDARPWPRDLLGGSGVAQLIPGLPQYWHPHLIGGRVRGELTVGGERTTLDGATVYAEKNWGHDFPRRWWWGQADAFGRADVCAAMRD